MLLDEHGEAIERELISVGLRLRDLGSPDFVWRDLWVIVRQADMHSPITRSMHPDAALWGIQEQLLAELVDVAHWLQWSKTKDAQSKPPKNMPEPIPRPGVKPKEKEIIKFDVMTQDEALAWLGWDKPSGGE